MVCGSCRQPFCWLCGAKTGTAHTWTVIEGHTCGEWKTEVDRIAQDSKAKHERYMHFYNHFTVCSVARVPSLAVFEADASLGLASLLQLWRSDAAALLSQLFDGYISIPFDHLYHCVQGHLDSLKKEVCERRDITLVWTESR